MENKVLRVPEAISGVPDGVALDAKCVHNTFMDKERQLKQVLLPCSMKADWTTGVMSIGFTLNGVHQSVAVRLDEVTALLMEASKARTENMLVRTKIDLENEHDSKGIKSVVEENP